MVRRETPVLLGGEVEPQTIAADALGSGQASASLVQDVHDRLRNEILTGDLRPGAAVSQAALARKFGVSRSPIREALRRLESEGLVYARHNQRVQIADFSLGDLEQIYASRIVIEALAVRATVAELTADRVAEMTDLLDRMREHARTRDHDQWSELHSRFHLVALSGAQPRLWSQILQLDDHARRYRGLYMTQVPTAWHAILEDDTALLKAVVAGNVDEVVANWARHLAKTALSIIAVTDPLHDARLIRSALVNTCAGSDLTRDTAVQAMVAANQTPREAKAG
jgi:DNA-binding GntR family transcriptional regulator